MSFFTRIQNGWGLTKTSLRLLNDNRSLLFFPILSGSSMLLILLSFFYGVFNFGDRGFFESLADSEAGEATLYLFAFVYYLINYFIIIFFNAALIHCAIKILNEEETSLGDGVSFAFSKIGKIFSWAIISATIGMILNAIQNSGKPGQIISSILGFAWSIMTFFVIPIIIYEDKGVFESIKGSMSTIKNKWGESLVGNTSLGIFYFIGILLAGLVSFLLFPMMQGYALLLGFILFLMISTVFSAVKSIFVAAVYNNTNKVESSNASRYFHADILDAAFVSK